MQNHDASRETLCGRIAYYSRYALMAAGKAVVNNFMLATESRIKKGKDKKPPLSEEVISQTAEFSIRPALFIAAALSPTVILPVMAATNIASLLYEKMRRKNQPFQESKKDKPSLAERIRNYARNLPRRAGVYTMCYALSGIIALAHYGLSSRVNDKLAFNPELVNLSVKECSLEMNKSRYHFYICGEMHKYNNSSSVLLEELIRNRKITAVLSEGLNSYSDAELPVRMFYSGVSPFFHGAGLNHPDRRDIAKAKGLPFMPLEKKEANGRRKGLDRKVSLAMGAAGVLGVGSAPFLYWTGIPLQFSRLPVIKIRSHSIITERNRVMGDNLIGYLSEYGGTPVVTIGLSHVDGLIKLLEERGSLVYRGLHPADIIGASSK